MKKTVLLVIIMVLWYNGNLFSQMKEDLGYEYWRNLEDGEKITFVRGLISGMYTSGYALLEYTDGDIAGITSFLPPVDSDHPAIYNTIVVELCYEAGFYSLTPGFIVFYQEEMLYEVGQKTSMSFIEIKSAEILDRLKKSYKGGW